MDEYNSDVRQGQIYIKSPSGEIRKGGYWMDQPEQQWGISKEKWNDMSVEDKLALETKQQATAYKPLSEQFKVLKADSSKPGTAIEASKDLPEGYKLVPVEGDPFK